MSVRQGTARRLIHDANPVPAHELAGSFAAPAAQTLLGGILASDTLVAGEPITELTRPADRWHRGRRLIPVSAAAVVLLVLGAVIGLAHVSGGGGPGAPSGRSGTTTPTGLSAEAYTDSLLSMVPTPPGAVPVAHAPLPRLSGPAAAVTGEVVASAVTWWTAPGTANNALNQIVRRVPPFWSVDQGHVPGGGGTTITVLSVRDPASIYAAHATVTVVSQGGAGVALREEVETYAVPVRSAAQVIPRSVTSAYAVLIGEGPPHRYTLAASEASSLGAVVNDTPTSVPFPGRSCPLFAGHEATVVFGTGTQAITLTANVPNCVRPMVTSADGQGIALDDGPGLVAAILTALHLHSDWFTSH